MGGCMNWARGRQNLDELVWSESPGAELGPQTHDRKLVGSWTLACRRLEWTLFVQ